MEEQFLVHLFQGIVLAIVQERYMKAYNVRLRFLVTKDNLTQIASMVVHQLDFLLITTVLANAHPFIWG